ncbi:MAG: GerMN domain-containing protein [Eubacteriales bacterium]
MKVLKNLIIIGIIVFCASTLPIFLSPMDFSSVINIEEIDENIYISLKSKDGNDLNDPSKINLVLETNSEKEIYFNPNNMIELEVFDNGNRINVENVEYAFSKTTLVDGKPLNIIIDISHESLDLSYGDYEFIFTASGENNLSDKLEVTVDYQLKGNYHLGTNESNGLTPIKLYFQTHNYDLVPVYRFVDSSDLLHNVIEEELLKGPLDNNLTSPIETVNYIILRDGVIYIDIPRDSEIYKGEYSENAFYSFVKTFSQMPNSSRIRFTFDNLVQDTWFNGINIRTSIPYPNDINVYIPVLVGERFYLSEKSILLDEGVPLEEKVERIYSFIKDNSNGYFQLLENITINRISLEGNQLTLDFDKNIVDLNSSNNNLQNMLIDSFLYSLTSIREVESIKFTYNAEAMGTYGSYDLNNSIQPYEYFNVENIE